MPGNCYLGIRESVLALQIVNRREQMMFEFKPLDWVTITMYGINYKGRVSKCHLYPQNDVTYTVEYIDDRAEFKSGDFRSDEIVKNNGA